MSLEEIKGEYDAIFSLGHLCLASLQLKKNQLRPFSGVLDWMGSHSLPDVSQLLKNRFAGFMDFQNLAVRGYANEYNILVEDEVYKIFSNHDFAADKNTLTHLATYPEVKEKFSRRIQRFLEKMESSKRILFVRTEGTFTDVLELESVLSDLVKNDFRILIVNHTNVHGLVEKEWPLEKVAVVELPNKEIWEENDQFWKTILRDVRLRA
jgi:hypothetical protein